MTSKSIVKFLSKCQRHGTKQEVNLMAMQMVEKYGNSRNTGISQSGFVNWYAEQMNYAPTGIFADFKRHAIKLTFSAPRHFKSSTKRTQRQLKRPGFVNDPSIAIGAVKLHQQDSNERKERDMADGMAAATKGGGDESDVQYLWVAHLDPS